MTKIGYNQCLRESLYISRGTKCLTSVTYIRRSLSLRYLLRRHSRALSLPRVFGLPVRDLCTRYYAENSSSRERCNARETATDAPGARDRAYGCTVIHRVERVRG